MKKHSIKPLFITIIVSLAILLAFTVCRIILLSAEISEINMGEIFDATKYDGKYAFITEKKDDLFEREVYESAREKAAGEGVYVEMMGDSLMGDYSKEDLLLMAIASKPMGIIVEASDTKEITDLIDEAVSNNIPVITYMHDAPKSERQSFIGTNYYILGIKYSEAIKEIAGKLKKDELSVLALTSDTMSEGNANSFYSSLISDLGEGFSVTLRQIDTSSTFAVEENLHTILLDEIENIDVVICLDEVTTTCMYSSLVDLNMVGDVEVVGYYNTESILQGIKRNVLSSSITVNAKSVGEMCVEALDEYRNFGYVSEYTPVNVEIINGINLEDYLNESEDENQ